MTRRRWLQGASALAGLHLLPGCNAGSEDEDDGFVCNEPESNAPRLAPADWFRGARVAGLTAFAEATPCDVRGDIARLADERVSVVEVDVGLGTYLDEPAFAELLRVSNLVARECHSHGMRCVARYPVLQCITPDADKTDRTIAKEHPDWVQIGIDGKPSSVITPGSGDVPAEESTWLCPTSGYVDYFIDRVKRLAGTDLDGVWGGVPLLGDRDVVWPCVNPTCNAAFKAATSLDAPAVVNFDDPRFLRWVVWRHKVLWDLEQRIVEAAKSARPDFEVVIETVTMDHSAGTVQGLDGAYADDGKTLRVWQVNVVSERTAQRDASEDDWLSFAAMMKHARGCSDPRSTWAFCYGLEEPDAERTMALAIAAGCSPYETKIPEINTSVGSAYRKRMYSWLEKHPQLLLSRPASTTAILYSSSSRDVLDRADAVALYTSLNPNDDLWWSNQAEDLATESEYVADYRGMCKMLFQAHVPFEVISTPHATKEKLAACKVLLVPSPAALATATIDILEAWVSVAGGTIVFTGDDAGFYDENAVERTEPALLEAFNVDLTTTPATWIDRNFGAGRVVFARDRAGRSFFRKEAPTDQQIAPVLTRQIETDAPKNVIFELRTADTGELVVAMCNLDGLGSQGVGQFTPRDASFSCAVDVGGRTVEKVTLTSPNGEDQTVPFTVEGTKIRFAVSVKAIAAALIALR